MKIIKKIAAIMLSVMMVLGMCSVVGAAGTTTSGTSAPTGSITINNAAPGETYNIYRILDLESYSGSGKAGNYAYKLRTYDSGSTYNWRTFINQDEISGASGYVTLDGEYVTWKEGVETTTDKAAKFAKRALAYAKESTKISADKTAPAPVATTGETTSTVTFTDLPLGYYLVETSVGTVLALNTTDTNVTIEEKNGVPSVEKKVKKGSDYDKGNTASIGDKVEFQTTITAQPGAQNYVLHDKMSEGLTFDNSVVVKKNEDTTPLKTPDDYVLVTDATKGDDCTFHIKFTGEFCNSITTETKIIVTYSATLNDKAVIAGSGNTNTTWLKYGVSSETNHDSTITKTFEIPVFKFTKSKDVSATEKGLANAVFTLSKNNDGRDPIELVDITATGDTDKTYRVAMESEKAATPKKTTTTVTTPSTGKFKIQGLDAGTYYLTETKQPDGYNKLTSAVQIDIKEDGTITVGTETITSENPVKVENKTGSILPSTGGMGTTLFYIFGAILVIGSGVVLITKKRMK